MTNATEKHTPGEWTTRGPRMQDMAPDYAVVADGEIIAEVFGRSSVSKFHPSEANATLIRSAPALLALARQYASECATCGGTGLVTIYDYDGNGSDADDQPCEDCADIRSVIARATNSEAAQ